MEHLWEKSSICDAEKAEYVDIFAVLRNTHKFLFDEWDLYIADYSEKLLYETRFGKDNRISQNLLNEGHKRFRDGNYRGALEKYNQSLCYAEIGTEIESLGYTNRVECFMQLEKYTNALVDIELALTLELSSRAKLFLKTRRSECQAKLRSSNINQMDIFVPKLSFNPNKNFPCMADVLEIRENDVFGRHVVANRDIDVGKTVVISDVFASGTASETLTSCRSCNKIERNFIACPKCPNAMFCKGSCENRKGCHYLECKSIFHTVGDTNMKLSIQTILLAIELFKSVDKMMEFVKDVIQNPTLPKSIQTMQSKYGLFLRLTQYIDEDRIYLAYQVYTTILTISQVKELFDTNNKRIFLMHLTLHHLTVIRQNSFRQVKNDIGWITTDYIYDVLSLVNHSCNPNLFNYSVPDDVGYCIAIRPIWKGDQVFISYLGNDSKMSTAERQQALKTWNFECTCERCKYDEKKQSSPIRQAMKTDPSFQYVMDTCQKHKCKEINTANGKRTQLRSECKAFLRKFGHSIWSPEIQIVSHCFSLH